MSAKSLKIFACFAPSRRKSRSRQHLLKRRIHVERALNLTPFFRFINPHYYIRLGDQTVMNLKKKQTFFIDTYVLEARGQIDAQAEQLLVYSVVLALFYERQQLKDLFEA